MRHGTDPAAALFTAHRALLFSIAYEIVGGVADAEDVLQESFLRLRGVDLAAVENPRAYLAQIVTRQALNLVRGAARRREDYVGPWLPEPLEAVSGDEPAEHVLTGEAVTTAMLLVLQSLTPVERAVFVLREVFAFTFADIATAVGKSEPAVRQIAHRARTHVSERRPRSVVSVDLAQSAAQRFLVAAATGDIATLMDLLAPDAVFIGDGGGVVSAARRPVYGADRVARFVAGLFRKGAAMGQIGLRIAEFNAMPSVVVTIGGALDQVTSIEVSQLDSSDPGSLRVSAVYCVRNPGKLTAVKAS